jgi:hypothetical protein
MENGWMDDKQETVRGHVIAEGTRAGGRDEDYTEGRVETVHDHDHGNGVEGRGREVIGA